MFLVLDLLVDSVGCQNCYECILVMFADEEMHHKDGRKVYMLAILLSFSLIFSKTKSRAFLNLFILKKI